MSVFLSGSVIAFLAVELIVIALMAISQFHIVRIMRYWDFNATSNLQYALEKRNYLINTILFFTIACKIILFIFFALCLNELSSVVPGAMCSAGVVGSNRYGNILLLLKILLIFGFGLWLILNSLDLKAGKFPYLKRKYLIFTILFTGVLAEFILERFYFLPTSRCACRCFAARSYFARRSSHSATRRRFWRLFSTRYWAPF